MVFPTSVSLVEPDAVGFDLRTPGLVSDAKPADALSGQEAYRQNLHQQMLSKQSPTSACFPRMTTMKMIRRLPMMLAQLNQRNARVVI